MSKAAQEPGAPRFQGLVSVERCDPLGMITLRGDPGSAAVLEAVRACVGQEVPGQRGIAVDGARGVAWMSPDELLLLVPHDEVAEAVAALQAGLEGEFALVADVSDARAVFRLKGAPVRDVLAKLCPVDFAPDAFGPGQIRRTRAAQVAAALWFSGTDEVTLVCFRSVAEYMFDLLTTAARPGGEVGLYHADGR
jgi:sarcosine oxidase, subunit gamma